MKTIIKNCKHCACELNENNAAKSGRNGRHLRNECKPCRSKVVSKYQKLNANKRRIYANSYARKIGRVKKYPCHICKIPTLSKGRNLIFCSDKCRLWYYVKQENECWIWQGALNYRGYGKFSMKSDKNISAHRASYLIFNGPIIQGLFVCHTCDNPKCVNPDHLWLGSAMDNYKDSIKKGRQRWQKKKENLDATTLFKM